MPEGHTVHRLARTFGEVFGGQAVEVSSPQGRFAAGAALVDGLVLHAAEAVGKQMFLGLGPADHSPSAAGLADDLRWVRVHLGLYGSWTFASDGSTEVSHAIGAPRKRVGERETVLAAAPEGSVTGARASVTGARRTVSGPPGGVPRIADAGAADAVGDAGSGDVVGDAGDLDAWEPPEPRGAVRVRILSAHAVADLTGPTACEVISPEAALAVQRRLGPDPLRGDADPERFVSAVRRSRSAVGLLLMNQDVVAGVGNIYRAEALFRAGQSPTTPGRDVPSDVLYEIWDDLVVLMADGAAIGAIVTTRPEHRGDGAGAPPPRGRRAVRQNTDAAPGAVPRDESFYVYQRDGLPCRVCGTEIARSEMAGRNLFWCPSCQRDDRR